MTQHDPTPLSAHRVTSHLPWLLMGGAGIAMAWAASRVTALASGRNPVLWVYLVAIGLLVWQLGTAAFDRPVRARGAAAALLAEARVAVLVPAYNEDDAILRASLASLLRQTHLPAAVCVVDDGSTSGDYAAVRDWFLPAAEAAGVAVTWQRTPNGGKRHAQVTAARSFPDADFYLTVDSDTQLDAHALDEALQPFEDPDVQSVAGTILVTNYRTNLLTRMQEAWFLSMQAVDRAALSRRGSVLVNSGPLAVYRPAVLWDNVDDYLGETLFGRPVHTSDDSMLTLYAQQRGRTVHQPSAFAFSHMPSTLDGHRRQQLRWMRGSLVRSGTRFRRLPTRRFSYWYHLLRWALYAAVTVALVLLAVSGTLFSPTAWLLSAVVVGCAQLLVTTPYLTLRRSDQTTGQRLAVLACAPLVGLWNVTVLRALRWYAMATFGNVAWGTRQNVEVTA
ncbi:glycosyltransferase family 2 protein [Cellulomonas fimi]|uniref:glycosyltransferase family 2 protein n=1 Tax=Cellulomonas fimi TaxID=1708 RepID=UPI00234D7DE4|nr:glycosyltransferase family 2 protein [Cellulomonas fimi]MDC7122745.1 glycosyltransferase family 2 protein [Cellulomonas fimi]